MHGECSFVTSEGRWRRGAQNGDRRTQQFAHKRLILILHEEFPPLIIGDQIGSMAIIDVAIVNAQHHRQNSLSDQMTGQMNGMLGVDSDAIQQYRTHDNDLETGRSDLLLRFRCYRFLDRYMAYPEKRRTLSGASSRRGCTIAQDILF